MPALLRQLIRRGCLPIPGAFNAATAQLIERCGFRAVYVSGAGLANGAAGVPDIGLLSRQEVTQLAGYIARAVKVPVIVDADTGFGGPAEVRKTVRAFENAGIAGLHIEDQIADKRCGHLSGKTLIGTAAMTAKLRAAVAARRDPDFLIIARTDARSVDDFEVALARADAYAKAGADVIFPEALQSADEFREFAKRIRLPLLANMTEFGRSPLLSVPELAALGYRMAIFPQTAFRIAMKAEQKYLEALSKHGTQRAMIKKMLTRQELYDLLDYDPAADSWPPGATQKRSGS